MTEAQARLEICRVGKSLFDRGYVHGTAGNISVKLENAVLITPTDACLGFLTPAQISKVNERGEVLDGGPPSKTLALHRRIYEATATHGRPAGCVIHTHSTHCVALTLQPLQGDLLPAITPYFVMKVGHVPVIAYYRPGDPKAAHAVAHEIASHVARATPIRAVMLSRLGPNVWHDSPAQAMAVLEELEETAKLMCLARVTPEPLDDEAIAHLRSAFGASW